jgi:ABC-type multidrug transport system fused ATPase/permease subunit
LISFCLINIEFQILLKDDWVKDFRPDKNWPSQGRIVFKNFCAKYRDELEFSLKDLSFEINAGEKIGICGRTGSGKSTLALCLFRMLDYTYGGIFIDGININDIGIHDLRHKLTIIPQDPIIFSGTIRMNLDPFDQYTDDQIWTALESVNIKDYVLNIKEKLNYKFAEGGDNLRYNTHRLDPFKYIRLFFQ